MQRRKRLRKKLHRAFLYDIRYEISTASALRNRLIAAPGGAPLEITPANVRRAVVRAALRRYRLRYLVEAILPTEAGALIEFRFTAREFPVIHNVSWNTRVLVAECDNAPNHARPLASRSN